MTPQFTATTIQGYHEELRAAISVWLQSLADLDEIEEDCDPDALNEIEDTRWRLTAAVRLGALQLQQYSTGSGQRRMDL